MQKCNIVLKGEVIEFDISFLEIDKEKNMVNITKIGKPFGKRVNNWRNTDNTKEVIKIYEERYWKNSIGDNKAITTIKGSDEQQGTWVCRELAIKFAQWISPALEVWCIDALDELFQTGSVSIKELTRLEILEMAIASEKEKELLKVEVKVLSDENDKQDRSIKFGYKAAMGKKKALINKTCKELNVKYEREMIPKIVALKAKLDLSIGHATIMLVETKTSVKYGYHALLNYCKDNKLSVNKVPHQSYGEINAYPAKAWLDVYGVDLCKIYGLIL